MDRNYARVYLSYIWAWRNILIAIFVPLLLLPLIFCFEDNPDLKQPMRCAYVIVVMVFYWSFECLPIAVTALLPMLLYPLFRIAKAGDLAPKYMDETNMAYLASIIVIAAFENARLHKLLALGVLKVIGIQQRWVLFGFMFVSWFLSMWMQNTMTTALLVPIVLEVSQELSNAIMIKHQESVTNLATLATFDVIEKSATPQPNFPKKTLSKEAMDAFNKKYKTMLLIAVAYSASIGGVSTLLGTSPNLMMKQQVDEAYESKGCPSPLNFLSWMIYGLPTSAIFLVLGWIWLSIYFCGPAYTFFLRRSALDAHKDHVERVIAQMYNALPPLGFRQWVVLLNVIAMVLLMLTRQLNNDPLIGWEVIAPGYVKESTAAIMIVMILFIFPLSMPKPNVAATNTNGYAWTTPKVALTWSEVEKAIPMEIILLIGGGMAAAYGAEASGLAKLLSELLNDLTGGLSEIGAVCVIAIFVVFVTEVMSNTACVVLMMPILRQLADLRKANPLFFMFPSAIAASFAFMFPVATPPNSIVFSAGHLRIIDMIGAGFVMNLLGIGVIILATTTYGMAYFEFDKMPWNTTKLDNGTFIHVCL